MGDAQTASTLTLVAGILQIIFSLIIIVIGVVLVGILMLPFLYDPYFMMYAGPFWLIPFAIFGVFGVISLIFGIIWLNWRNFPSSHKTGLIVSGILALIFGIGTVPGILALVAGAIAPSPSEFRGYEPVSAPSVKASTVRVISQCPSCGADINSGDHFCWRCGGNL
jgi:hypothetical protein